MAMTSRANGAVSRAIASKRSPLAPLAGAFLSPGRQAMALGGSGSTRRKNAVSSLRDRRGPGRGSVADAGANAVGLQDQVRTGEIDRHDGMLDDLQRSIGLERLYDVGREPPVGCHQSGAGHVDARLMRGGL